MKLQCFLNWLQILREEVTAGLEEQPETAMGNFSVISAVREVEGQDFASVLHHPMS